MRPFWTTGKEGVPHHPGSTGLNHGREEELRGAQKRPPEYVNYGVSAFFTLV